MNKISLQYASGRIVHIFSMMMVLIMEHDVLNYYVYILLLKHGSDFLRIHVVIILYSTCHFDFPNKSLNRIITNLCLVLFCYLVFIVLLHNLYFILYLKKTITYYIQKITLFYISSYNL